jgi:hypothetical protein
MRRLRTVEAQALATASDEVERLRKIALVA